MQHSWAPGPFPDLSDLYRIPLPLSCAVLNGLKFQSALLAHPHCRFTQLETTDFYMAVNFIAGIPGFNSK